MFDKNVNQRNFIVLDKYAYTTYFFVNFGLVLS